MACVPHPVEDHPRHLEEHRAEEEDDEDQVDGVQLHVGGLARWFPF